ncbi:MAG: epoxyqueuosine reductase QueH [Candidatus Riflebacteria bacterium]|nr:epoxyqueuosine reductase QueH [Candidatus Riflebacteria bacterium]
MAILLHTCCGPCLTGSYPLLEANAGAGNTLLFWENPNIHPFIEYQQRLESFKTAATHFKLEIIFGDTAYGLNRFLHALNNDFGAGRCEICYRLRLEATAKAATIAGIAAFTTTLLISPYQDHELLIKTGKEVAAENGVAFHYTDFRPGFRGSNEKARELGLYRQKYCGCIFSEHDRYKNDKRILNPGVGSGV